MAHKFLVPDEAQLEKLIVSVYEKLPVPEITRLNRIEERLSRKLALTKPGRKVNTLPWWIVLLIAGGFATAAWWAGEQLFKNQETRSNGSEVKHNIEIPVVDTENTLKDSEPAMKESQQTDSKERNSTIIYQRETF